MLRAQHGPMHLEELQRRFSQVQLGNNGMHSIDKQSVHEVSLGVTTNVWHLEFDDIGLDAAVHPVHTSAENNRTLDWSMMDVNPYFYGGDYDGYSNSASDDAEHQYSGSRRCIVGCGNSRAAESTAQGLSSPGENTGFGEFEIDLEGSDDESEDLVMGCALSV